MGRSSGGDASVLGTRPSRRLADAFVALFVFSHAVEEAKRFRNGPFVLGLVARLRNASPGLVAAKTDAAVVPFHFEVHAFYLGSRRDAAVR
jgi:hypothetical protein